MTNRNTSWRLAGAALVGALAFGGAAVADENLTWSYATAQVGTCVTGVTCGQPNGVTVLQRESLAASDVDYNNASVHRDDYSQLTSANYGTAWASAEAGEGTLGLPVLKAFADGGLTGSPPGPFTIAVNYATVLGVQGYTNTGSSALLIPLSAFTGLVDYNIFGSAGTVGAGLAITTSAVLDPGVADLWWQPNATPGSFGQFAAGCGTAGALAVGGATANMSVATGATQYLGVATQACGSSDTFLLDAGETFYIWARLGVVRSAGGVTDASHTFNVSIAPEAQADVAELLPSLTLADGANFIVNTDAAVPEPSSWAMMILGFGAAGAVLRRRRWAVAA
jgi:hypothetical protein